MKYYIIAGERSGDLHGSNLFMAIKELDSEASATGIGGDYMKEAGVSLSKSYEELALIGFLEIVEKLGAIRAALKQVRRELTEQKPDVVILIDYAGFNLRVAKFARELGIKVFYYISPKVWAWNQSRAFKIKRLVDRMFVILPFEREFYKRFDYEVDYVGNPVLDAIDSFTPNPEFMAKNKLDDRPIIAILPGSRKNEIESTLYRMLSVLPSFPDHQFVVAAVGNHPARYYDQFRRNGRVHIVFDQTYDLLHRADLAVVASGTATLETALFGVPQVVCYRVNAFSYLIAKMLIKVKYISLVNLIADQKVVTELIQNDFNPVHVREELHKIERGTSGREEVLRGYTLVKEKIGKPGASKQTATLMLRYLKAIPASNELPAEG